MTAPTSIFPGPKVMLIGPSGSGKTHCLYTLVLAGFEVFIFATDNGIETIGKFAPEVRDKIHYKFFAPATSDWGSLIATGKALNLYTNENLQKMEDLNKSKYTQLLDLLGACNDFVDQNGKSWGAIDKFGPDKAIVLDNLSGLNTMTMNLSTGGKPIKTQPDWGKAMDYEERIITSCTSIVAPFILIGHVEREVNEVTGGIDLMVGALGRKLAPKLPRLFSDVILARRQGEEFFWSTASMNTDLKTRNLPISDKLAPDFRPLMDAWRKTGGLLTVQQP